MAYHNNEHDKPFNTMRWLIIIMNMNDKPFNTTKTIVFVNSDFGN